jgi:HlyD family secretion protein
MSAAPTPIQVPERVSPPRSTPVPVQPEPRKPWLWLLVGVVVIGAIVGYNAWRNNAAKQQAQSAALAVKTAKVTAGPFEKRMRVGGQTSARQFVNVNAPLLRGPEGGRDLVIIEVVPSGSWVKKGQVIARIDGQSLQDHVDDLKDTIEAADADVRKAQAEQLVEWENLQQTMRLAKAELDKARLDYTAATVRTDVEQQLLKLSLDEAEARYQQQMQDLENKQVSMKAQIKILEYTRERHVRHRNRHLGDLEKFTIRAGMDGLAVMSQIWRGGEMGQFQQGDRVSPGQMFMKVVNPNSMMLEASVNQTVSSDFRVGQDAVIGLDAFPGLKFTGKIHSIGALAVGGWRQNYYIRTVPVLIRIDGKDDRLIPDLSASADILFQHVDKAVQVPLSGIEEREGKTYAQVKTANGFESKLVKLGARNATHAVVIEGLEAGQEVRVN